MAAHGEKSWPSVGTFSGRPWGGSHGRRQVASLDSGGFAPGDGAAPRPGLGECAALALGSETCFLGSAPARATHRHAGSGLRHVVVAHVDPSRRLPGAVRVAPWGCLGQCRDRGSPGARRSSRCLCCCPAVEAVLRAARPQARRPVRHRPASRARPVRAPVSSRRPSRPCSTGSRVHRRRPGLRLSMRAPRPMRSWRRRSSNLRQGGRRR